MRDILKIDKIIFIRSLKDKSVQEIRSELSNENWEELLSPLSCNEGFDVYHTSLVSVIERVCPEKRVKLKGNKKREDPWITKGIKRSIVKQKKLYKESITNVATGKTSEYKLYKARLQNIIRKSKQSYLTTKCNEYQSNVKKMWQLINSILRKETNELHIIDSLSKGNLLLTEQKDIANEFGEFFANVGRNCAQQIPTAKYEIGYYLAKIPNSPKSIFLAPTNELEIRNIIQSMRPKSSSGFDGLSNKLIKDLCCKISLPLSIIFNKSMEEGVFPDRIKAADVTPLFKSKDQKNKTNY